MKASGRALKRYIFASSIAVYGPRAAYPAGRVPMLAEPQPVNVYGVWKLAGEQISKFFWEDTGVPTLSLRPGVLYGPGRDAGLTASPTTAMKCLALGLPFKVPFRSRQDYLYAPDVGGAVGNAVLEPFDGYGVFTLPSRTLKTAQIVEALRQAADELGLLEQFKISVGEGEVPFICDLEYDQFTAAFPNAPHTALDQSLRESLEVFLDQVHRGWLTEQDINDV
jgi:nucleoside-diphosphate-sugar epimerase